ncbi:hypothetical protein FPANT_3490 [Fusarium pseudoanthophilum]|uniref:Uncharacterized protein n=1 Tax=Fusarium pseudoanthophilum TaxID=48495 RepID=A0A8H5UVX3_9HYPO|nr:hypothetical protein FPANT_3490 [Fusarium pseudoanthophilum]
MGVLPDIDSGIDGHRQCKCVNAQVQKIVRGDTLHEKLQDGYNAALAMKPYANRQNMSASDGPSTVKIAPHSSKPKHGFKLLLHDSPTTTKVNMNKNNGGNGLLDVFNSKSLICLGPSGISTTTDDVAILDLKP